MVKEEQKGKKSLFTSSKKKKNDGIPKTLSDSIPYKNVYENGIVELPDGRFSKSYWLPDTNFVKASDEKQSELATSWGIFLGQFEDDVTLQTTIFNKTLDLNEFKKNILFEMKEDGYDEYRKERNNHILQMISSSKNNIEPVKLLTVSLPAIDIIEATQKFNQIENKITEDLSGMLHQESKALTIQERLEILYAIYNPDEEHPLYQKRMIKGHEVESFSLKNCKNQGITTKDVIAPDELSFKTRDCHVGEKIVRNYYISNLPTWVKGSFIGELADIPCNMLVSTYYKTIPQEKAMKMLKAQNVNIGSDIISRIKKTQGLYDIDFIAPSLKEDKEETEELLDALRKDNARLFTGVILITLYADDENELQSFEKQLKLIVSKNLAAVRCLVKQQEQAYNAALPLGYNVLKLEHLWSTNTVSVLLPFANMDIKEKGGNVYGQNASSKNLLSINRKNGMNPCMAILAMPGAGKSFTSKEEMTDVFMRTNDEIYIIDPEGEYVTLAKEFNGSVIKIASGSSVHINPFDMHLENVGDDGDPVKVKSDFIESIVEIAIGGKFGLSPIEKSLINNCVMQIYEPYVNYLKKSGKSIDIEKAPTMRTFHNALVNMPQSEAQNMALALERYVKGSLDVFAYPTNVEINNRFTVYDIKEIGTGLMDLGLQICLDNIWNKMISNRAQGKTTWFYIDEFYKLMRTETSAAYISEIWKRIRKWNGIPTCITQNVEDLLASDHARTVLNNCNYILMLNQSPLNRGQLSKLYDISEEEQKYISSPKSGVGLFRVNNSYNIPRISEVPNTSKLYKLFTTKPSDDELK